MLETDLSDDVPCTQTELASALRTKPYSIRKWIKLGYEFQFGTRTTPGHCKRWLEKHRDILKRKPVSEQGLVNLRSALAASRLRKKEKALEKQEAAK
jgi:hypothetical protein